ncbi:MAG TPA: hypothetical protein VK809_05485, partial [Bacteroidia bacterium]|nr:hypothetical protein [Bacteroidia bacterium]
MRKVFFLALSIVIVNVCFAQITFEKNYYIDRYYYANQSPSVLNTIDSGYMVASYSGDSAFPDHFVVSISRLDKHGSLLWNKLSDPYTNYISAGLTPMVQNPDSTILLGWNDQGKTSIYERLGFIKLDKTGNPI